MTVVRAKAEHTPSLFLLPQIIMFCLRKKIWAIRVMEAFHYQVTVANQKTEADENTDALRNRL